MFSVYRHRTTYPVTIKSQLLSFIVGLAWQSGDQWKQLRHAARKALRCCGVGNQSLEERILFEVEKLINELSIAEASGDALDPSEVLHEAVTNILCSAIFGCRLVYG